MVSKKRQGRINNPVALSIVYAPTEVGGIGVELGKPSVAPISERSKEGVGHIHTFR